MRINVIIAILILIAVSACSKKTTPWQHYVNGSDRYCVSCDKDLSDNAPIPPESFEVPNINDWYAGQTWQEEPSD